MNWDIRIIQDNIHMAMPECLKEQEGQPDLAITTFADEDKKLFVSVGKAAKWSEKKAVIEKTCQEHSAEFKVIGSRKEEKQGIERVITIIEVPAKDGDVRLCTYAFEYDDVETIITFTCKVSDMHLRAVIDRMMASILVGVTEVLA